MKKKLFGLLLAAALILSMTVSVFADDLKGGDGWYVNFTGVNPLETNFTSKDMTEAASAMEPGDNITFTVTVKNTKSAGQAVNYYMKNEIIKSFEEGEANGAAYKYKLSYKSPDGTESVFYDNTSVGGDDSTTGLVDVNSDISDYFYFDQLDYGKEGVVTLYVELDGDTQGNDYWNTLAELNLQFQVEEVEEKEDDKVVTETTVIPGETVTITHNNNNGNTHYSSPTTGDSTKSLPLYIAMAVVGIAVLAFAIILLAKRRRSEE